MRSKSDSHSTIDCTHDSLNYYNSMSIYLNYFISRSLGITFIENNPQTNLFGFSRPQWTCK